MKEIKLNGSTIYRNADITTAFVNENELEFINGVALAKADVRIKERNHYVHQDWYGLIDENYNEVFYGDKYYSAPDYLMFNWINTYAKRINATDFLVKSELRIDDIFWTEYNYLRYKDGKLWILYGNKTNHQLNLIEGNPSRIFITKEEKENCFSSLVGTGFLTLAFIQECNEIENQKKKRI